MTQFLRKNKKKTTTIDDDVWFLFITNFYNLLPIFIFSLAQLIIELFITYNSIYRHRKHIFFQITDFLQLFYRFARLAIECNRNLLLKTKNEKKKQFVSLEK